METTERDPHPGPRIGLALGSGAARGWAHIGAIRALAAAGIAPDVVCGSSVGALVGGAYAAGALDELEAWACSLGWREVLGFFDIVASGGLIRGERIFHALRTHVRDRPIESLPIPFAAVACELETGREVWLRSGSLLRAIRASATLPGLVAPIQIDGAWLVDGGLVNSIPVSLCRVLGAELVIAVDLQTTLLHPVVFGEEQSEGPEECGEEDPPEEPAAAQEGTGFWKELRLRATQLRRELSERSTADPPPEVAPSLQEVISRSLDIVQYRIGRSRLAGDPPDVLIAPRLAAVGTFDLHKARQAIECGRAATARTLAAYRSEGLGRGHEGAS